MRRAQRLIALLVAVAVVAGAPLALLWWADVASIDPPKAADFRAWLVDPLQDDYLLVGLLAVAALLWLVVVAAASVAVVRAVRRGLRRLRALPLPTATQVTASSMAGAAAFGIPAAAVRALPPLGAVPVGDASEQLPPAAAPAGAEQTLPAGDAGIDIGDDGWMPSDTARLVAAAAGMGWLHLRRGYLPAPPGEGRRDDISAAPVAAVAAAQASRAEPPAVVAVDAEAMPVAQMVPSARLAAGVLRWGGPGADAAARGTLITALLQAPREPGQVRAVVTSGAAVRLFGHPLPLLPPSVRVIADLDAARAELASAGPPDGISSPSVVLLTLADTGEPTNDSWAELTTPSPATVVVLGAEVGESGWHLNLDGGVHQRTNSAAPTRLCVLNRQAAVDLLAVIRAAGGVDRSPALGEDRTVRERQSDDPAPDGVDGAPLQVAVFGEVGLTHRGADVVLRRSAAVQTLAFLAVHPQGATARQLSDALWPDLRPHTVTGRLYTTISELRRTLEPFTAGQPAVQRTSDRYRLDPDLLEVDLWHHHHRVRAAAAAITTADQRKALRAIIDARPGELAAGQSWPWLAGPREAVRRDLLDAYTTLAELSGPAEALALLNDALHLEPYNDELHRQALRILAAAGDTTAVSDLMDAYTRRLARAGLRPSPGLSSR